MSDEDIFMIFIIIIMFIILIFSCLYINYNYIIIKIIIQIYFRVEKYKYIKKII